MKDEVNTSSVLFSGKKKNIIHITHFSNNLRSYKYCTFRMQLTFFIICVIVFVKLFIGSISKIFSDKILLFKFTNIQLIYQHFYQQLQCKDIHIVH